MEYTKILKRAWAILWSYRVLWIFGVLLALTSGGGGGSGGSNYRFGREDFNMPGMPNGGDFRELNRLFERLFSEEMIGTWITIGVALLCLFVVLAIIGTIVKYVSHTALIRMVDEHERSGEKIGFRQGWRLGWSRAAWRLFLIDLLISLPIIIIFLGFFGCGMLLFMGSGMVQGDEPGAGWIAGLIGFILLIIALGFVIGIFMSLIEGIIRRYAVLENAGVIDSLRGGLGLIRRRFVDVLLMWLILVGLGIVYVIAIIPIALVTLIIAALLGGGLGMLVYFGMAAAASEAAAIAAAIILGLPLFILIMAVPLTFLEGLRQVYGSTVWTLAYRELTVPPAAEDVVEAGETPAPVLPENGE